VLAQCPASCDVVALYASDEGFPGFVSGLNAPNILAAQCDLANPAHVADLVGRHGADWDCCLYLAGKVDIPWSVANPRGDLLANTIPLLNVVEAIRADRFVYFSSGAVYDGLQGEVSPLSSVNPSLPYAISKLACERYVEFAARRRKSIARYLVVRFFGAYGPYEAQHKIYTRLIRAFALERQQRYTIYGDGLNLIDAMFIDDAVEAIRRMIDGDHWNATVNLAGGHPVTIERLVCDVAAALDVEGVVIEKSGIANEKNDFWGSVSEMETVYGFTPRVGLADGVRKFRDFLTGERQSVGSTGARGN
jgi:UDP-glucose 4-epimerase